MAGREALAVFLESLERKSYYEILRVHADAQPAAIKAAFYDFSLLYHPDRHVGAPAEGAVATEIYKRGVEAYRCLSRRDTRARYDEGLARGLLRPNAAATAPPPPVARTLEAIARTPAGKKFALKADRLLTVGKLTEARVELVSACQREPDNEELTERLQLLYEALALEPS